MQCFRVYVLRIRTSRSLDLIPIENTQAPTINPVNAGRMRRFGGLIPMNVQRLSFILICYMLRQPTTNMDTMTSHGNQQLGNLDGDFSGFIFFEDVEMDDRTIRSYLL